MPPPKDSPSKWPILFQPGSSSSSFLHPYLSHVSSLSLALSHVELRHRLWVRIHTTVFIFRRYHRQLHTTFHFPYYSVLSPYSFILISNHCQPSLLNYAHFAHHLPIILYLLSHTFPLGIFCLSCLYFIHWNKSTPFQFAKIAKAWRLFTFMSHFRISMTIRPGVYCPITLSRNEPFNLDWGEPILAEQSAFWKKKIVL